MIDFTYTPEQRALYDTIAEFAGKELNHNVVERDQQQVFAAAEWKKCGALKLQGLCVPAAYGGAGLDAVSTAIALEALGYGCTDGGLGFSIAAHLLACVVPVWLHGSEAQKKELLPGLCSGTIIAANAMTEAESGSDAFALKMSAAKKGKGYVLNGKKNYISNAPVANVILVYAATDPSKGFYGGISAFVLPGTQAGISCSLPADKMGLRSCLMADLLFENVDAGPETLLGREGAGAMLFNESMLWERSLLSAVHVGTMQRLLERCILYAGTRTIKGESIGRQQAIAHRVADMKMKVDASRLMVYKAASDLHKNTETCAVSASLAKVFVSEALNSVCREALGIFGAAGYMTGSEVERHVRDAAAATIYSGTNDIQRNMIAAWLGL